MEVCVHARVPMDPSSIASFNGEMFVQLCIEFPRSCACKKEAYLSPRECPASLENLPNLLGSRTTRTRNERKSLE